MVAPTHFSLVESAIYVLLPEKKLKGNDQLWQKWKNNYFSIQSLFQTIPENWNSTSCRWRIVYRLAFPQTIWNVVNKWFLCLQEVKRSGTEIQKVLLFSVVFRFWFAAFEFLKYYLNFSTNGRYEEISLFRGVAKREVSFGIVLVKLDQTQSIDLVTPG